MPERVSAIAKAERRINVLEEKIGVLEHRVGTVEDGLKHEVQRAVAVDTELKELLIELKNKNPITEFVATNWKFIAIWIVVTSGGDVTQLLNAFKALGG